jgi:hypothetical protein
MWIFTRVGFFSCIADKDSSEHMIVRARVRRDIDQLRSTYMPDLGEVIALPNRDYPFRAKIYKNDFADGMAQIALDIDYTNFKNTVAAEQGYPRAKIYGHVWQDCLELENLHIKHPDDNPLTFISDD